MPVLPSFLAEHMVGIYNLEGRIHDTGISSHTYSITRAISISLLSIMIYYILLQTTPPWGPAILTSPTSHLYSNNSITSPIFKSSPEHSRNLRVDGGAILQASPGGVACLDAGGEPCQINTLAQKIQQHKLKKFTLIPANADICASQSDKLVAVKETLPTSLPFCAHFFPLRCSLIILSKCLILLTLARSSGSSPSSRLPSRLHSLLLLLHHPR